METLAQIQQITADINNLTELNTQLAELPSDCSSEALYQAITLIERVIMGTNDYDEKLEIEEESTHIIEIYDTKRTIILDLAKATQVTSELMTVANEAKIDRNTLAAALAVSA